jgi:hypothetical protein
MSVEDYQRNFFLTQWARGTQESYGAPGGSGKGASVRLTSLVEIRIEVENRVTLLHG